jgi:endonuclease/exonuclease/phosphatase family metal-dependent hydrolase
MIPIMKIPALLLFGWLMCPLFSFAQDITAMTYNIRYDTDRDGINRWDVRKEWVAEIIKDVQPSVFGVQEALHHQLTFLDSVLTNYTYEGVGRDDGKQKGEYTAVFVDTTRYRIMKSGTFWLSPTTEKFFV